MALRTSLAGRVQNTTLPKTHALLPLLEAVVNGIQAIDARYGDNVGCGTLSVRIQRTPQEALDLSPSGPGRVPLKPIIGFTIEDNGVGFTSENMASFETLDSDYKAGLGCRGVGRLLWLKAFDRVEVRSAYFERDGGLRSRQFKFSVMREVEQDTEPDDVTDAGSVVSLTGFKTAYQQSAAKTVEAIAREVFEHCIWYFLRPAGAPDVVVSDDEESVSLRELLDDSGYSESTRALIDVKGEKFDLLGLRLKSSARNSDPRLHWCAANRVVRPRALAARCPGCTGGSRTGYRPSSRTSATSPLSSSTITFAPTAPTSTSLSGCPVML